GWLRIKASDHSAQDIACCSRRRMRSQLARRTRMFNSNDLNAPKIVCDISDATVAAAIATMKTAIAAGADAFHLNISRIDYRDLTELQPIFDRIRLPVFCSNRRASFFAVYGESTFKPRNETDEERMAILLRSVQMGGV